MDIGYKRFISPDFSDEDDGADNGGVLVQDILDLAELYPEAMQLDLRIDASVEKHSSGGEA